MGSSQPTIIPRSISRSASRAPTGGRTATSTTTASSAQTITARSISCWLIKARRSRLASLLQQARRTSRPSRNPAPHAFFRCWQPSRRQSTGASADTRNFEITDEIRRRAADAQVPFRQHVPPWEICHMAPRTRIVTLASILLLPHAVARAQTPPPIVRTGTRSIGLEPLPSFSGGPPLDLAYAPDGTDRVFVAGQGNGQVRVYKRAANNAYTVLPFLDIPGTTTGGVGA